MVGIIGTWKNSFIQVPSLGYLGTTLNVAVALRNAPRSLPPNSAKTIFSIME
jgi:hypothetical protein